MTAHLTAVVLNSLADGELTAEELAPVQEHLAGCPPCTASALEVTLLKSATARTGRRYAPPSALVDQLTRQTGHEESRLQPSSSPAGQSSTTSRPSQRQPLLGWATAAIVLIAATGLFLVQKAVQRTTTVAAMRDTLATEAFDQHVAALAAATGPQVISSSTHTVKPWFQGKLSFSFNLPEILPAGDTLDGANLTYLHDRPAAQLLYSIGKHRVSVFVTERGNEAAVDGLPAEHSGFHLASFNTGGLEAIAISDVNPARLAELVRVIEEAQDSASK